MGNNSCMVSPPFPQPLESDLTSEILSVAAAYMLLGLSHLSFEIENPFGNDNNDLPLDRMCDVITTDVDVICAHKMSSTVMESRSWMFTEENKPLMPVVKRGIEECLVSMTVDEIREALRLKVEKVRGEGTLVGENGNGVLHDPENDSTANGSVNSDMNGNMETRNGRVEQLDV